MKSTRLSTDIKLILKITIAWMLLGVLFTLYDYLTTSANEFYIRTEHYNFTYHLLSNIGGAFLGGILGASLIILYTNRILRRTSFPVYLFLNTLSVLAIIVLINIAISIVVICIRFDVGVFNSIVFQNSLNFIISLQGIKSLLVWFVVTVITIFLIRVNEKYGPGVLTDIILGKYHQPKGEQRIFMFLDIKSSTTLAEKLGNKYYFNLLKDFFADITDSILYNKGEIYQYVGDEVVISWKVRHGIENNNCLNCFFEARKEMTNTSPRQLYKESISPSFPGGTDI